MRQALFACAALSLAVGCSETAGTPAATVSGAGSPVVASTSLGCSGDRVDPPENFTVLFDVVALPTSDRYPTALQTSAQGKDPEGRLFAKTGLWFKLGRALELVVPEDLRERLSIGWPQRSWSVVLPACTNVPSEWVVLAGGYWVADPLCADLIVRSGGQEQRVSIGVGVPCPGQAPPPPPSDQ